MVKGLASSNNERLLFLAELRVVGVGPDSKVIKAKIR